VNIKQFFLCSHRSHCFGAGCLLVILALATILWPQCAPGQQPPVPKLTLAQVEQLVSSKVPDSTMSTQIQKRGLAFAPTPAMVESMRAKGAGPLTLEAIEALVPKGTRSAAISRAASANEFAIVIDPPSNVRVAPSAASGIICSVTAKKPIRILGSEGHWYKTDICDGKLGYIHRSQIKF
jgi:hypothetical protein